MTEIYLIRHAQAEGNLYRMAHGHYNGMITNYRGYQQIDALRQRSRSARDKRRDMGGAVLRRRGARFSGEDA